MADDETGNEAAQAFDRLRAEVALLRSAVERLAVEWADGNQAPDYSETLGVISQNLSATAQRVDALVRSPALSLTPEETGRQISAASFAARREDQRLFIVAGQGLEDEFRTLQGITASVWRADVQRRWLMWTAIGGIVVGMILWAALAHVVSRACLRVGSDVTDGWSVAPADDEKELSLVGPSAFAWIGRNLRG